VGLTLDLVVVGYLSQETIVNFKGEVFEALGGPAAYVSMAAAKLGAQVGIVSNVGTDFKTPYRRTLAECGVDLKGVRVSGERTTTFRNAYDQNDRRTQTILALSPAIMTSDLPSGYMTTKWFHFGPIFREIEYNLIRMVHRKGSITSLDPQGYLRRMDEEGHVMSSTWAEVQEVMPFVDVYRSDDNEARLITGESNSIKAAEKISDMGPRIVLITMERKGSILFDEGRVTKIPLILADRFVDSTGAGDAYIAGFAVEYLDTMNAVRSAIFAACTASFKIEGIGVSSLPTRAMVERRLRDRNDDRSTTTSTR